jgi:DNA-binding CsgD family transcriptional regulator
MMLGVARSTARTHLQRLFEKTGKRRQVDLLRMVAAL